MPSADLSIRLFQLQGSNQPRIAKAFVTYPFLAFTGTAGEPYKHSNIESRKWCWLAEYVNHYIRNRNPKNLSQRLKDVAKQSIRGICVPGLYSFRHRAWLNPVTGTSNG